MSPNDSQKIEETLLCHAYIDPSVIDKATQAGIGPGHFIHPHQHHQWRLLCELRLHGKPTTPEGVYMEALSRGCVEKLGGVSAVLSGGDLGSIGAGGASPCIEALVGLHARRESYKALNHAMEEIKGGGGDLAVVQECVEKVAGLCAGHRPVQRSINDVHAEVGAKVAAAASGKRDTSKVIEWGLPKLDKYMLPIERHEYVLICARPSRGKSSMLTHLAGHNLKREKRVVIFTLETSDTSVFMQMAAQWCGLNLKTMHEWMPNHAEQFKKACDYIKDSKRLLIFDKDMTLEAIESRCRLLAASFKPDLVIGDYLGLVRAKGKDIYERVSTASKAMIPLTKSLGCPVVFGQQLKRLENEKAEPTLADLRDSGQLEEDVARCVMLHWTESQYLDQETRPYKILQPKLRDGPTTAVSGITFHAPTTRFMETSN